MVKSEIGGMAVFFSLLNQVPEETCFLQMLSQN